MSACTRSMSASGLDFHIGADRDLLDADRLGQTIVLVEVAVALQCRFGAFHGSERLLRLLAIPLDEATRLRILEQVFQILRGCLVPCGDVAEEPQGGVFDGDVLPDEMRSIEKLA